MIAFLPRVLLTLASCAALTTLALAAGAPSIVTPDSVAWKAGAGPMKGAQVAVLEGNPSKSGAYTIRVKVPDGAKFGPHFHGDIEHVTVLSGTLLVGLGDKMNVSKMKALPAGSYAVIPSGLHHFAMAKGVTVIQIHGTGPTSMNMVASAK